MENLYTPNCIRTFTGKYFNILEPTEDMIDIVDIAHSLAHQCRFAGHLPKFYSVAEHSYNCCKLATKENAMAALLHDASEAYLIDVPKPVKRELINYDKIEDNIMRLIANKFKFKFPCNEEIKNIDKFMLETEWHSIMLQYKREPDLIKLECLQPAQAKERFLNAFFICS